MLAIGRALMTNPALLLLDEPLEGLAPIVVEELTAAIRRMSAEEGTALILVEQHAEASAVAYPRRHRAGARQHRATAGARSTLWQDQALLDRLIGLRLSENVAT